MKMPRFSPILCFAALWLAGSSFAQAPAGPEHKGERAPERQFAHEMKMERKLERREERRQERKQERMASHPYLPDDVKMKRELKGEEGGGRLSFEERLKLRRDINNAGRELYKPPPRD